MAGIMQKLRGKVLKIGGESGKRMRIIQPFDKVFVSLRLNNLLDYEESDRCKRKGKG